MVCVPCIVIPFFLFIWHKFIQPIFLRFWNPWGQPVEGAAADNAAADDAAATATAGNDTSPAKKTCPVANLVGTNSAAAQATTTTDVPNDHPKVD